MMGSVGAGISIVCVFNNPHVRIECLDASIAAYDGPVDVDYVPVDNTGHAFASAGAALNHGARLARHDVVVFVHQDVFLHSVDRLAEAGAHTTGDTWGILGACGIDHDGAVVGRLRDRVQLIGSDVDEPVDVDSLDEVLFLVRRDRILAQPLSEDPDLAWHAYAVEYGLRMREQGLRVGAVNTAITHNSLTINLDRLDVAHRRVATLHPDSVPARTTCGVVGQQQKGWREHPVVRRHGWRLRWLRNSGVARRVAERVDAPVVIADIRLDVDLLNHAEGAPLHVLNLDRVGGFASYAPGGLRLTRYERPMLARAVPDVTHLCAALEDVPAAETVLITEVTLDDVVTVVAGAGDHDWLVGVHDGEIWLLGGDTTRDLPQAWTSVRSRPLGRRRASV